MDIEKAITDGIVFKGGKSSGRKNDENDGSTINDFIHIRTGKKKLTKTRTLCSSFKINTALLVQDIHGLRECVIKRDLKAFHSQVLL